MRAVVFAVAVAVAVGWGCSDTECHDRLGPDGELVMSDKCSYSPDAGDGDAAESNGGGGGGSSNTTGGGGSNATGGGGASNTTGGGGDAGGGGMDGGAEDSGGGAMDSGGGGVDAAPDTPPPMRTLVGDWVSQGDDLSPLLREGGVSLDRVTVSFDRQGGYEGLIVLDTGDEFPFRGSYSVDDRTSPMGIVLNQSEPQSLTSEGIYAIEADGQGGVLMRYEVVQTQPPTPGFQPPTPSRGFGSTVGVEDPEDNIQIYRPN